MTVSTSTNKFRYEGNGVTDTFAFTARLFSASDLVVEIITRADDGLVETLTITTDYSVTINSDESASVQVTNVSKIPTSLQDIQVRRVIPQTQSLDLPTGTVFPASSVENALDKLITVTQDLQAQVDLKVGVPVTDSDDPPDVIELLQDATEGVEAAQEAAELSAGNAATSETNALASENKAHDWAEEDEDVEVEAGEYSARHWAIKALANAGGGILSLIEDLTPQLGGDLDVNGKDITGAVKLNGITYPSADGTVGQVLTTNGSGAASFSAPAVSDVFGRTGSVTAASGDYDASQVDNDSGVSGSTVSDALNTLNASFIGVGQTWQDVTASRANNTVYTNSTGSPIYVTIGTTGTSSVQYVRVDGLDVALMDTTSSQGGSVSVIVPAGSTYECTFQTIQKWMELR